MIVEFTNMRVFSAASLALNRGERLSIRPAVFYQNLQRRENAERAARANSGSPMFTACWHDQASKRVQPAVGRSRWMPRPPIELNYPGVIPPASGLIGFRRALLSQNTGRADPAGLPSRQARSS